MSDAAAREEAPGARPAAARGWPWLAAYAATTFLAFPHPVAGRVVDLGLVTGWLAPACLALGLRGLAPGAAARRGFLAGLVAHAAVLHWIYVVTVTYGHAPAAVGVVAPLGLAAYIALFTALFAAVWRALDRRGVAGPWVGAALWAALDHARTFALSGFPWAALGYSQHANGALLGLASATGVHGLSFAVALGGLALARGVEALPRSAWPGRTLRGALGGVLALHAAGAWLAAADAWEPERSVRVAALQGNIDQGVKWSPAWADEILSIYSGLSRRAAEAGAQWIVWPETAAPGSPSTSPELREALADLARETGATLVVGAVGIETGPGDSLRFFDSAFLWDAQGELRDRYDKAHLVPFGEYVPLRDLLGLLLRAVARGMAPDNVTPGGGPRALRVPVPSGGVVSAGVPICYELLFPDEVRRFVGDGARVLLAITNDAWYGRTGAPYQFLAMTALRSAETGVWTVRAANTGVSAIIDARGGVRQATAIFERDLLVADVPLRPAAAGTTPYVRYGDWLAWLCWTAVAIAGVRSRMRSAHGEDA